MGFYVRVKLKLRIIDFPFSIQFFFGHNEKYFIA